MDNDDIVCIENDYKIEYHHRIKNNINGSPALANKFKLQQKGGLREDSQICSKPF